MKFYISTTGIKRVTVSRASGGGGERSRREMKGKHFVGRRLTHRTALVLLGLISAFLFVRTAFLILESAALCSSSTSIGCMTWRFVGGDDAVMLREELTRALVEVATGNVYDGGEGGTQKSDGSDAAAVSFEDLVRDMTISNTQDIKAFAIKTKALIKNMEGIVRRAKWHESIYWHLAAHGVPKSLHCLSLKLAEEYAVNAAARSSLPLPQYVHCLTNSSFQHIVLLTDNVLAASVVVSSVVKSSANPKTLVFHVVTDKKSYTSMHAWFALNQLDSAVVEVKGLHQYDWPHDVNADIKDMLEIHHQICNHKYKNLKKEDVQDIEEHDPRLDVLSPSCISLLNHLRIYLPKLFPDLDKVVFLDHDIVVQRDLSSLWNLDLNNKVVGAVVESWCGSGCCPGRKYTDYFNFTDPIISSSLDQDRCGWLSGMNVFDLKRWRDTNITAIYQEWLKLNLNSGYTLWHPGALPPTLIAFDSQIHRIDHSWHVAGLGHRCPELNKTMLEAAAVIHFSGPAKPWLEIGSPEVRSLWYEHVNLSNENIRRCAIRD